jgi:hypothetical protein
VKRHPALAALSRDHHHALVVAQRLKRSSAASAEEARQCFLEYWERDGAAHFREEEDVLLPALARFTDPDQPVVARVLIDHVRIRSLALEAGEGAPLERLQALGLALERHVRREERELFPLLERALPDAALRDLAAALS